MSTAYLQSVESILTRYEKLATLNSKQVSALRANITRTLKSATEANDKQIIEVLEMVQAGLPEPKAKPSKAGQTADEIVKEYEDDYLGMSFGRKAAFKAKVTRRINLAMDKEDQESCDTLTNLQARIERDDETIRRNRIFALAGNLADIDTDSEEEE